MMIRNLFKQPHFNKLKSQFIKTYDKSRNATIPVGITSTFAAISFSAYNLNEIGAPIIMVPVIGSIAGGIGAMSVILWPVILPSIAIGYTSYKIGKYNKSKNRF